MGLGTSPWGQGRGARVPELPSEAPLGSRCGAWWLPSTSTCSVSEEAEAREKVTRCVCFLPALECQAGSVCRLLSVPACL